MANACFNIADHRRTRRERTQNFEVSRALVQHVPRNSTLIQPISIPSAGLVALAPRRGGCCGGATENPRGCGGLERGRWASRVRWKTGHAGTFPSGLAYLQKMGQGWVEGLGGGQSPLRRWDRGGRARGSNTEPRDCLVQRLTHWVKPSPVTKAAMTLQRAPGDSTNDLHRTFAQAAQAAVGNTKAPRPSNRPV